jgi:Family of unknown function (DUF6588)
MRKQIIPVVIMLAALFLFTRVEAQDFSQETLGKNYNQLKGSQQGLDAFDDQIKSILKLFSSLVGSGFVNTASLHSVAGIDVGVRGVIAAIPDEFKDILPNNVPNVTEPFSGTNTVPFPFLHASVGLPANFEIMAKVFSVSVSDKPSSNVTLLGGALKYGLLKDNLTSPAIALLAGYQTILVPDEYAFGAVSTLSFKGFISKDLSILTLYGGGGVDFTSLKLDIPGLPPDINKRYDVTYPSGTVGLTIKPLPLLKVNADANLGVVNNITVGVALSFR